MAKEEASPRCVSGFVKGLKRHSQHHNMTFSVARKVFTLTERPETSTLVYAIRTARQEKKNILLFYKERDGVAGEITGVIVSPLWAQRAAAQRGDSYEDILRSGLQLVTERMGSSTLS